MSAICPKEVWAHKLVSHIYAVVLACVVSYRLCLDNHTIESSWVQIPCHIQKTLICSTPHLLVLRVFLPPLLQLPLSLG